MYHNLLSQLKFLLEGQQRHMKPTTRDEFVVYISEYSFDAGDISDLKGYQEVVDYPQSKKLRHTMIEKM